MLYFKNGENRNARSLNSSLIDVELILQDLNDGPAHGLHAEAWEMFYRFPAIEIPHDLTAEYKINLPATTWTYGWSIAESLSGEKSPDMVEMRRQLRTPRCAGP